MTVAAIRVGTPASLGTLTRATLDDPGAPGPGEVRVRLQASSLNYHDFAVVCGMIPTEPGRIPMSDGAGVVEAVGAGVTATSSSGAKLEKLRDLGADELINYKETEAWGAKALELTGGAGVDTVVEIGGAGTLDQSMVAARVGGHVALIGILAGYAGPVQTVLLMAKNLRVQGLTVGSRTQQLAMIAGLEATGIKPVISDRFALADLADAFRHQAANKHFGKIVVEIPG